MNTPGIRLFIVTGRTGHSLVICKALPFSYLKEVEEIVIFSETEGFKIPKCRYISIPEWIRIIKPSFIRTIIRIIYEPIQLFYFTLRLKPDIINGIYCLPKGLNSLIAAKLTGTRCLISVIGSRLEVETELPFRKIWGKINIWQLKNCDAISIKGKKDRDYLTSRKINPQKMFALNGAIDTEQFAFVNGKRPVDLLFLGTFYELKGPDRFLKIVQMLLFIFPNLRAVMVGDGILWKITKEMAFKMGINQNILFEGYKIDTVPYFQQSKILVLPSRSESLPTSMLEAMSCGCIPVVSDVGNVREAADHNVNSKVVYDFKDIKEFVTCISDLLNNPQMLHLFSTNARKKVEDVYSIEKQSVIAKGIIDYLTLN